MSISKLYSSNLDDALWITIDGENITFEETLEDFTIHNDKVITHVLHFQYFQKQADYFIIHFEHEFIFYSLDDYQRRLNNPKQKGQAQKRLKSFKADQCMIPFVLLDYGLVIYFVLDRYFQHKDLLKEYFAQIIE